jgi:SAM-dependent methyltransferase
VTGYVTDTPYADTFFRELSPAWINYVAALNGVAPRPTDRAFNYLELGSGFGTSVVVNAAAFPHGFFHACDFNEAHIDGAREYAGHLGVTNVTLHMRTFESLLATSLPRFDFIVLHGVYSWVDAATREVIRQLIARLLLPGGLVYVSYNALPGWSHELPLRKLLVELAATIHGTAAERSEQAATLIDQLSTAGLRYFTVHPAVKTAVDAYRRGEGHYLAHEFLNDAWEPFYAVDVADGFADIGLEAVGSATLVTNHLPLNVDARAAEAIAGLPTPRQQQLAVDFATNQRFRRDVFVRPDGSPRNEHYLEGAVIGCPGDTNDIGVTARVPRGEIRLQDAFIGNVRTVMAGGSVTFRDAVAALGEDGQDKPGIGRNLLYLVASGVLAPFACVSRASTAAPTKIATPVVEHALRGVPAVESGRRVVPSAVYGNGIEVDAADARRILEWAQRGGMPDDALRRNLSTFARLGLVA